MPGTATADLVIRLAVATLGGLAVGVEREWSAHVRERHHDFGGVRTFPLLGLLGGIAAEVINRQLGLAGGILLATGGLLVVAAYVFSARAGDPDATTEVAGLLVLASGLLAGLGELALASGICALTALLLVEKGPIHSLVFRLESKEIEAGLRFAVLAAVVLPILPTGPFGPAPGFRPRELWALVLIFAGLSFLGYVGLRVAGPERGYSLAGLLGGLVSSTVVTFNLARESRRQPALGRALALGILAASIVLCLRVPLLAGVLDLDVGIGVLPYMAFPFVAGLLVAVPLLRREAPARVEAASPDNPLKLGSAIQMALVFQLVLYAVHWLSGRFGSAGLLGSAAVLGLTDMDALTYSMAKAGADPAQTEVAVRALAVGVLSNTAFKLAVALVLGRGRLRQIVAIGFLAIGLATLAGLLIL